MNNLHLISHQNSQGRGEREWLFGSTKGGADKHFLNKSTAVVAKIEILKQDVLNICPAREIQSSLFCRELLPSPSPKMQSGQCFVSLGSWLPWIYDFFSVAESGQTPITSPLSLTHKPNPLISPIPVGKSWNILSSHWNFLSAPNRITEFVFPTD